MSPQPPDHWFELDSRLQTVEKAIAGQEAALIALGDNQRHLSQRVDDIGKSLTSKLDRISTNMGDSNKTNWGVLASWLGVATTIMIYHTNLTVAPLSKSITELDTALQREIRLINNTTESKVSNLDSRLQREMTLLADRQEAEIDALRGRVVVVDSEQRGMLSNYFGEDEASQLRSELTRRIEKLENKK